MLRLLAALALLLPFPAAAAPLKVVTTFTILEDMTRQIGGDAIIVTSLVRPNADVHHFEPSPADIRELGAADLLIVNGLGLEPWLGKAVVAAGYTGELVKATAGINTLTLGVRDADPHAWQDLANGKIYVANIRDALIKADPSHEDIFRHNAGMYLAAIDGMNSWAKGEIAKIPPDKRRVITGHDAFQYFAAAYGVQIIPALGIGAGSSPSAADIARLTDRIKSGGVHAVFFENVSDPRFAEQLKSDAGAYIGGTLYSDALTVAGGPADSYLGLFRSNVTALVDGMNHN